MKIENSTIMSAEEARRTVRKVEIARIKEEVKQRQEREDERRAEAMERYPETLKAINQIIQEAAGEGKTSVDIALWGRAADNINGIPWTDIDYIKDPLGKLLFNLGYEVSFGWYNISYAVSTGKYAAIEIKW